MLIQEVSFCESLRRIVSWSTADFALREDLMQECLIRLCKLENEEPGRTRSWYLQNCRFHLQHCLAAGRRVDSPKRANGGNRIALDGDSDEVPVDWYHTNGELREGVMFRDLVSALACRLGAREGAVLAGLAEGSVLQEVAADLELSYPTALKYRRKIADWTVRLGISPPPARGKENARPAAPANGADHANTTEEGHGVKRRSPTPSGFPGRLTRAQRPGAVRTT